MALTLSTNTTVIDTLVDSDTTINTTLNAVGNITAVDGFAILPISNTKSKIIMVWH